VRSSLAAYPLSRSPSLPSSLGGAARVIFCQSSSSNFQIPLDSSLEYYIHGIENSRQTIYGFELLIYFFFHGWSGLQ
jgi:hypothetical protein